MSAETREDQEVALPEEVVAVEEDMIRKWFSQVNFVCIGGQDPMIEVEDQPEEVDPPTEETPMTGTSRKADASDAGRRVTSRENALRTEATLDIEEAVESLGTPEGEAEARLPEAHPEEETTEEEVLAAEAGLLELAESW